jgi:hypothetical protein
MISDESQPAVVEMTVAEDGAGDAASKENPSPIKNACGPFSK